MTFKYALKSVAKKNGLHATFMPKLIWYRRFDAPSEPHASDGTNAFSDESLSGLSDIALSYIAGQPPRPVPGDPAGQQLQATGAWATRPVYALGPGEPAHTVCRGSTNNPSHLVELRCPDPAQPSHLRGGLAAGLDGVEKE